MGLGRGWEWGECRERRSVKDVSGQWFWERDVAEQQLLERMTGPGRAPQCSLPSCPSKALHMGIPHGSALG